MNVSYNKHRVAALQGITSSSSGKKLKDELILLDSRQGTEGALLTNLGSDHLSMPKTVFTSRSLLALFAENRKYSTRGKHLLSRIARQFKFTGLKSFKFSTNET